MNVFFCCICKRHVEIDIDDPRDAVKRFRAFGHDDSRWPATGLLRGPVGVYLRPDTMVAAVEPEIEECFNNQERIAA